MPAPTNINAATAINISSLPFTTSVNQTDWTLASGVPLWWKYTAGPSDVAIGLRITATSPATVYPYMDLTASATDSTQICEAGTDPSGNSVPAQGGLVNGTVYYIVAQIGGSLTGAGTVNITLNPGPSSTLPAKSLFISDDMYGFPGIGLGSSSGSILRATIFASGENAGISGDGHILVDVKNSSGQTTSLSLYDSQLTFVSNRSLPSGSPNSQQSIAGNLTSTLIWAVGDLGSGVAARNIYILDETAVSTLQTWPVPVDADGNHSIQGIALSSDGTIILWIDAGTASPIHKMITATGVDSILVASDPNYGPGEIITLSNDDFVVYYHKLGGGGPQQILRAFNSSGVQQGSDYAIDFANYFFDHMRPGPNDPTDLVVWTQDNINSPPRVSRFLFLNVGTWTTSSAALDFTIFENGNAVVATSQDFGPSNSCPLILTSVDIPLVATGTIIVTKVSPDVIPGFDFVAGGGLSPGTFTLAPGGSREFDDVDAGSGYSITETVPDGWSVVYTVSNGSPHTNITVAAGETVTVTVTNSIETVGSGIYQITPDLPHDQIYLTYDPVTTTNVKFDPFADIYLAGDE